MKVKVGDIFLISEDDQGNAGRLVEVWKVYNYFFRPRIIGEYYDEFSFYGEYCNKTFEDSLNMRDKLLPLSPAMKILFGVSDGN